VGIALLADVVITPTYSDIVQQNARFSNAGLSPFNSSIADVGNPGHIPVVFWKYFPSVLVDPTSVTTVAPSSSTCNGKSNCVAYFLTGGMSAISPRPNFQTNGSATGLAVYQMPGVQVEFYSLSPDDSLSTADCAPVYGSNALALELCVKQENNDLIAGQSLYLVAYI